MEKIRRALLIVHDKTGIVELARALVRHGAEILSTGGTARLLTGNGVAVTAVSDFTGAPEILGGRVKTLHPKIHGGILGLRDDPDQAREMEAHAIGPIDAVVVNLYPFAATIARPDVTEADALENIDIGGPTMIRAAAKNHAHVAVVVDPADYDAIVQELDTAGGAIGAETRAWLARKAFARTTAYDAQIASWLGRDDETFAERWALSGTKVQDLRYGENPHQTAAFYASGAGGFGAARKLQGKELSYNNLLDLDAAVGLCRDLEAPAAVIVKHTNPCGAAVAGTLVEAYRAARATDPVSAFGGVVALAGAVDTETARELASTFIEAVAAPGFSEEALGLLSAKKNLRLLDMSLELEARRMFRQVAGGILVQDVDRAGIDLGELTVVTERGPTDAEMRGLRFAWIVAKHVKSNAIVYTNETQTVGVGAGQMSRVDSARIAAEKAVLELRGTVCASDAFFPFRDGLDAAAAAGATAVIQPGGSKRDAEVIAAADEHGMAMVFTGERHFRH